MSRKKTLPLISILFAIYIGYLGADDTKQYAIVNGTIISVVQDTVHHGTLLIKGGEIADLGDDVSIPSGVEIIDGNGLFVYPGLIDASSILGLYEVGAVTATRDYREMGTYNSHIEAAVALNPNSVHIPITRMNGITTSVITPSGGVICGQCALVQLKGWTPEEMTLKTPVAMAMDFPRMPTKEEEEKEKEDPPKKGKKSRREEVEEKIKDLKDVFNRAKRYTALKETYRQDSRLPAPEMDLMLEALVPAIKGEIPVIVSVNAEEDIRNAVQFVEMFKLKAIFRGVDDGWKVAPLLAEHEIDVVVGPVFRLPDKWDPYDARFANAGILHRAGVRIAFFTESAASARDLPYHAGMASAFGLPKEEALRAVTVNPVKIFGFQKIGTLEVGNRADVVVTDGDILELRTQIRHLFIGGEKIDLHTYQTELYEKFSKRPVVDK